jgi:hypothetical protein
MSGREKALAEEKIEEWRILSNAFEKSIDKSRTAPGVSRKRRIRS